MIRFLRLDPINTGSNPTGAKLSQRVTRVAAIPGVSNVYLRHIGRIHIGIRMAKW